TNRSLPRPVMSPLLPRGVRSNLAETAQGGFPGALGHALPPVGGLTPASALLAGRGTCGAAGARPPAEPECSDIGAVRALLGAVAAGASRGWGAQQPR